MFLSLLKHLPSSLQGARVIELGSGPGLAGMLLAKMGAITKLTDKAC